MSRMDELDRLASGYGFRPQGKSNPMRSDGGGDRRSASARTSFYDDDHRSAAAEPPPRFDYDSFFNSAPPPTAAAVSGNAGASPGPVYDKPVYDDDLFGGLPGVKSKSMSAGRFEEDGFSSNWGGGSSNDVDLLGKLGGASQEEKKSKSNSVGDAELEFFANLTKRPVPESSRGQSSSNVKNDPFDVFRSTSPSVSSTAGVFIDPLDDIANLGKPSSGKPDNSSGSGGAFDDLDPLGSFGKPSTPMSPEKSSKGKDSIPSRPGTAGNREHVLGSSSKRSESPLQRNGPEDRYQDAPIFDMPSVSVDAQKSSRQKASPPPPFVNPYDAANSQADGSPLFDMPSVSVNAQKSSRQKASPPPPFVNPYDAANSQADGSPLFDMPSVSVNAQKSSRQNASSPPFVNPYDAANSQADGSPESEELSQQHDDVWLTVSEIPLFTQPTRAPPPSRPPPSIPRRISKIETGFSSSNARKKNDDFVSPSGYNPYSQSPKGFPQASKGASVSSIDELEDFAMRKPQHGADEVNFHTGEEMDASSVAAASAAAMKDAMDKAEAKFRHAKEVREREYAKGARNRDEHNVQDAQEREFRENQERLDQERRQREDEEIEKRRVERERARAREIENARQKQAVERATREARERAGIEARLRAERAAQTEARERSERAAVHRAQAEARERAAAGAKERAEKAAAEARERANAEAKEKEARDRAAVERAAAESRRRSERAAAERAAAEARARAAAQAQEKAASAAQASQPRNDNDLESFFNMNSRPNSAPRPRASSPDAAFDAQFPNPASKAASSNSNASNMRKASSAANIFDGLSSVFEAPSTGGFNEVEGETEERRRARLERHQRTQERAAKALAEKNQRDVQAQREQEERHRIADTLDIEIKRWAAGKEGNLRALLSTLQYVLWPECGWTSVSLTDLITGAQVKKVYRKATLCIHPDKVQQKGANLQQKYIAEKVFDMLKEAWNKFNSEELF